LTVYPRRIIGSAGITIPGAWYLWPDSSNGDAHGPGDAHAKQVEEHPEMEQSEDESEDKPEEESKDDESKDEESKDDEPKDDEANAESKDPKDDGETKDEGGALKDGEGEKTQEQPQANNEPAAGESKSKANTDGKNMPESKGDVEGVSFKGPTKAGDSDNKMPDERKREPDGKGGFKKRIDSGYGKNLGEGPEHRDDGSTSVCKALASRRSTLTLPKAATSKTTHSGNTGDISTKQAGLSTTPTRHSTRIDLDPEMSKKSHDQFQLIFGPILTISQGRGWS
jgi:hypothetical protein